MTDPGEAGASAAAGASPDRAGASPGAGTSAPATDQIPADQAPADQTPPDKPAPDQEHADAPASEKPAGEAVALALTAADRLPRAAAKPRHPLLWAGLILSVALLATLLLWPAADQLPPSATARAEILEIEQRLDALAFPPGTIDGVADQATATAIRDFQRAAGLTEDGAVSPELLAELRSLGD